MYGLWARKLRKFDFEKAKVAIGDWFTEAKNTGRRPPTNKIIQCLLLKKAYDESLRRERSTPVKAFGGFCEDWQPNIDGKPIKRKFSAWSPSLHALKSRDPQEIEGEAERVRQRYINWYGGSWIVTRDWMQYFEECPI